MSEHKVILTWEAIYDVTDIADYIEAEFGEQRADRFQSDIQKELKKLEYMGSMFSETQIWHRGYAIHKKQFPLSIVFYVFKEAEREEHVLRGVGGTGLRAYTKRKAGIYISGRIKEPKGIKRDRRAAVVRRFFLKE